MSSLTRFRPSNIPVRARLTLWYTLSLSVILLLLAVFLYVQLRDSLFAQVDSALQLAAAQALVNLDTTTGQPALQSTEGTSSEVRRLSDDFVIYLLTPDGSVIASLGSDDEAPAMKPAAPGFTILALGEERMRVFNQTVRIRDARWLQVMQDLESVQLTLRSFRVQMFWILPLAILLAGLVGFFLAGRALRPVDQMTRTARSITAHDLNQRIDYQGPTDEIGRLALTFDSMLDRLQMAFQRERRFTGDAAHELRTPLAALKGRIGVTLNRPRKNAEYTDTLEDMEEQVDRLIRLSNDLLFMARLDQGQLEQSAEPVELDEFLSAVVEQVRPLAQAGSLELTESVPDRLYIMGNPDLLIRLFLNLLDNAIKFTPPGGQVTVWAQAQGNETHIAVSDTGPGIEAEHLPYLFDRFYRVEADRSRNQIGNGQGGAGLGLAIAYEITRLHGGMIAVHSEVGSGTTFVVKLPTWDGPLPEETGADYLITGGTLGPLPAS